MKKILPAIILLLSFGLLSAQNCSNGRYKDFVFPSVTVTSDITYSTANSTTLKLDVYEPTGDTASFRPLIILAHGGSFISGTKTSDIACTTLCNNLARRGYVCASIDYRLSSVLNMLDSAQALDELVKAISDAKSAIRFFRKDAATANTYRINPNLIYGGGNSAGAVIFMHVAYIDSLNECPADLSTMFNNNGGFEGNSGNAGYSSNIAVIINLAGGLNVPEFIGPGNLPSANFQGDADDVFPYLCGFAQSGVTPVRFCGLSAFEPLYTQYGINHVSVVFPGQGHVPWNSDSSLMTQVDTVTANFLLGFSCGIVPNPVTVSLGADQTVCSGFAASLNAIVTNGQAPYTYSWSSTGDSLSCYICANPFAAITQNSVYSVTVFDFNGDTASATIHITICTPDTCNALFQMFPDSAQGVYFGYNVSTGNNLSYIWYFGDGDSSSQQFPSHTYAQPGQYYICLTVHGDSSCTSTYCDSSFYVFKTEGGLMSQLTILDPTGIRDIEEEVRVRIYPNPASNMLFIETNPVAVTSINIYDMLGNLVSQTKQPVNNIIDISQIATGVYIAEIKMKDTIVRKRWMKM